MGRAGVAEKVDGLALGWPDFAAEKDVGEPLF